MIRKINRVFQNFLRNQKVKIARLLWDKKEKVKIIKEDLIEKNGIDSIIIMRDDGKIGDMVVSSFIYREIKKQYPNIKIGVVTRKGATDIIKDNHYVDKIYEYKKDSSYLKNLANEIAKEKYDLLIDTSTILREKQIMFISKCDCKINLGVDKEGWQLFDISVPEEKNSHITKRFINILEVLGIKEIQSNYDIQISDEALVKVEKKIKEEENILEVSGKERVILNPYTASKHRNFNRKNIEKIIEILLKYRENELYLLGHGENKKEILEIKEKIKDKRVHYIELAGIQEVIALIKNCEMIISPDTSIVHIGVGLDKKVIAIYREDVIGNNGVLWGPNSDKAIQIFSKENKDDDINNFDMREIERAIS
ncbi:glycosyltransferase family 9 protein [Fusobacterium mortiferum]|jgi:ADP-heptose:LPS heptosyltransferase|uniref:Lipopolysaccharide heptosyltransferase family protein n=1 Tax=Fusobacterium mortiferum ATCC 9817 TaxID=469616 RepID=A0ABN5J7E1_FUSMR|nr:glycosyltransferase family 9 protein [Fusobacterium mortiferum]AVQ18462.1 lipopolysaccharide heptosyltransferase family protein [Fusobacterium mortiferum ATCC 9817]EEO34700.1 Heptosyltransferase [Fusobacterium mortiferum ATCC 9817]